MTDLQTATQRIDAALARLESAIEKSSHAAAESAVKNGEMRTLAAERDGLSTELAAARAQYRELVALKEDAAGELDGAILRLQEILDSDTG